MLEVPWWWGTHLQAAGEADSGQLIFIGLIRRRDGSIVVRRYGRLCRRDELGRMGSEIQLQSASHSKEQMCLLGRLDEREALTTRCATTDHLIGARHRHLTMGTAGKNHHCVSFRDLQKKRSVVHYFRLLIGAYLVTVQTEVERLEYL